MAAAAILAMALGGCFDDGEDAGGDAVEGGSGQGGCEPGNAGVAFRPGGIPALDVQAETVGCLFDVGHASWEPTVALHPTSGAVYFHPAGTRGASGQSDVARSEDGGKTWSLLTPNAAGVPTHPITVDPYMHIDPDTGRLFVDDLFSTHCAVFSWSDDEGQTWGNAQSGCTLADHISIITAPPTMSTTIGYPNVVYRCGIEIGTVVFASFGSGCQKSVDGGQTWVNTGTPAYTPEPRPGWQGVPGYCDGGVGHGFGDKDGTLYLPKGHCGVPTLAISRDEGLTWARHEVSDLGTQVAFCQLWAHDAAVGVDPAGTVYYGWIDNQRAARLALSRDGGLSWEPALNVSAPGVTQAQALELAVGAVGKVTMVYFGSTNAPTGPFQREPETEAACEISDRDPPEDYDGVTWDAYIVSSWNADAADPVFVATTVNPPDDPVVRGQCRGIGCPGNGDFIDIEIGPDGTPWASLVDACVDTCATGESSTVLGNGAVGHVLGPSLLD